MSTVLKLKPNNEYLITEIKSYNTSFGTSYVLTDIDFNKYFGNKKIETFIRQNNITNKGGEVLFKIITGPEQMFTTKDGKEIKFIDCRIVKK